MKRNPSTTWRIWKTFDLWSLGYELRRAWEFTGSDTVKEFLAVGPQRKTKGRTQ